MIKINQPSYCYQFLVRVYNYPVRLLALSRLNKRPSSSKTIIPMFPYPSGDLHIGHSRCYTISDVLTRFYKLNNYKALQCIGFDSFGLPAENAARYFNKEPLDWTLKNVKLMREQFMKMNFDFDYSREIITSEAKYYKFVQMLFLDLMESELCYQKYGVVNYDPIDKTVLANEQVDSKGRSWRSGAIAEKRIMKQWYFKITQFQEELLEDLEILKEWPEKVKTMQRNWIGKTKGYELELKGTLNHKTELINIFFKSENMQKEKLADIKLVIVNIDHPIVEKLQRNGNRTNSSRIKDFIKEIEENNVLDYTRTFKIENASFINPINGEEVDVYISPSVMLDNNDHHRDECYSDIKIGYHNSLNNTPFMVDFIKKNKIKIQPTLSGKKEVKPEIIDSHLKCSVRYKLKDWTVSRQRRWGTPIPVIKCNNCGILPVKREDLPIELPENINTADYNEWASVVCYKCGSEGAKRELDTMDTFVDSSLYFMRYLDINNRKELCNTEIMFDNLPIDIYVGGVEHSILHLLYARFISKFYCKFLEKKARSADTKFLRHRGEPFLKLITQGMVKSKVYKLIENDQIIKKEDVVVSAKDHKAYQRNTNREVYSCYEKMSKSKFNGVDPNKIIKEYGSDVLRLYLMFKTSPYQDLNWDEHGIKGLQSFIHKISDAVDKISYCLENQTKTSCPNTQLADDIVKATNQAIKNCHKAMTSHDVKINVYISELMKLNNYLSDIISKTARDFIDFKLLKHSYTKLAILLSPVAPDSSQGFYHKLNNDYQKSVHLEKYPQAVAQKQPRTKGEIISTVKIRINNDEKLVDIRNGDLFKFINTKSLEIIKRYCDLDSHKISSVVYKSSQKELVIETEHLESKSE